MIDNSIEGCRKIFNVRAILIWTTHDYPGYGDVSKYSVQGHNACPLCGRELQAHYSPHLKKMVYEGHSKFLPMGHHLRGQD